MTQCTPAAYIEELCRQLSTYASTELLEFAPTPVLSFTDYQVLFQRIWHTAHDPYVVLNQLATFYRSCTRGKNFRRAAYQNTRAIRVLHCMENNDAKIHAMYKHYVWFVGVLPQFITKQQDTNRLIVQHEQHQRQRGLKPVVVHKSTSTILPLTVMQFHQLVKGLGPYQILFSLFGQQAKRRQMALVLDHHTGDPIQLLFRWFSQKQYWKRTQLNEMEAFVSCHVRNDVVDAVWALQKRLVPPMIQYRGSRVIAKHIQQQLQLTVPHLVAAVRHLLHNPLMSLQHRYQLVYQITAINTVTDQQLQNAMQLFRSWVEQHKGRLYEAAGLYPTTIELHDLAPLKTSIQWQQDQYGHQYERADDAQSICCNLYYRLSADPECYVHASMQPKVSCYTDLTMTNAAYLLYAKQQLGSSSNHYVLPANLQIHWKQNMETRQGIQMYFSETYLRNKFEAENSQLQQSVLEVYDKITRRQSQQKEILQLIQQFVGIPTY